MIIHVPARATQRSMILHEPGYGRYAGAGVGLLSIKSFFGGQALYEVGRNRYRVGDGAHLILNHGQKYALHIDSDQPLTSFCLFFAEGFVEAVHHSLTAASVIDDPFKPQSPLNFFEKTYPYDDLLSPTILNLYAGINREHMTLGGLEEHLHLLAQRLLQVHTNVYREVETIPAARRATREELYRRLHCARDYAAALFNTPVSLVELAEVACLSPNYLLRSFKPLFGQTPHQFIISQRLEAAQRLLLHSDRSITEICFAVGFESLGTFSWLFRRRFGCTLREFRQQKK